MTAYKLLSKRRRRYWRWCWLVWQLRWSPSRRSHTTGWADHNAEAAPTVGQFSWRQLRGHWQQPTQVSFSSLPLWNILMFCLSCSNIICWFKILNQMKIARDHHRCVEIQRRCIASEDWYIFAEVTGFLEWNNLFSLSLGPFHSVFQRFSQREDDTPV